MAVWAFDGMRAWTPLAYVWMQATLRLQVHWLGRRLVSLLCRADPSLCTRYLKLEYSAEVANIADVAVKCVQQSRLLEVTVAQDRSSHKCVVLLISLAELTQSNPQFLHAPEFTCFSLQEPGRAVILL